MSNGYRTLSQHLNDLKKENFSLKLRIYFLEERIQQKYEESSEDVYRTVSRTAAARAWANMMFFFFCFKEEFIIKQLYLNHS